MTQTDDRASREAARKIMDAICEDELVVPDVNGLGYYGGWDWEASAEEEIAKHVQAAFAAGRASVSHREVQPSEHDPANGVCHGDCAVCKTAWPCGYAPQGPATWSTEVPGRTGWFWTRAIEAGDDAEPEPRYLFYDEEVDAMCLLCGYETDDFEFGPRLEEPR